jgi:hypothetical protein
MSFHKRARLQIQANVHENFENENAFQQALTTHVNYQKEVKVCKKIPYCSRK